MEDTDFFQPVDDRAPFRQGDIIRQDGSTADDAIGPSKWGVIITADCDIAQQKMGEYFTYLVIRTARNFVEEVWAAEELAKLENCCTDIAIEEIQRADQTRDPDADPLSRAEVLDWLRSDGTQSILDALGIANVRLRGKIAIALDVLAAVDAKSEGCETPLQSLRSCWCIEGRKLPEQCGILQNALKQRQMRAEFMLAPTLPTESELGFVVMIRDVRAIRTRDLYKNRLDLRIADASSSGMYRIGRFSDFIRYAIAQRMANLFSRIGMSAKYETECEAAAGLTLESLISTTVEQ